jgi:hypothetical protein
VRRVREERGEEGERGGRRDGRGEMKEERRVRWSMTSGGAEQHYPLNISFNTLFMIYSS